VTGTVDSSGNVVSARKYDVYGSVRQLTGPSGTKHKFVGQLGHPSDDETGLVYMRARYHDPVTGRFVSEDGAKEGHNWFEYACSTPTELVDWMGASPQGDAAMRLLWDMALFWLREMRLAEAWAANCIEQAAEYRAAAMAMEAGSAVGPMFALLTPQECREMADLWTVNAGDSMIEAANAATKAKICMALMWLVAIVDVP
jgi:RHS repeat-associated protein